MKGLHIHDKKPYEAPTMELLVIAGREMMDSEHDNGYVDVDDLFKDLFSFPGYYDV